MDGRVIFRVRALRLVRPEEVHRRGISKPVVSLNKARLSHCYFHGSACFLLNLQHALQDSHLWLKLPYGHKSYAVIQANLESIYHRKQRIGCLQRRIHVMLLVCRFHLAHRVKPLKSLSSPQADSVDEESNAAQNGNSKIFNVHTN